MDIIKQKGLSLSDADRCKLDSFIEANCSAYYIVDFLRITSGNVDDAISLYFLDEDLRAVVLKYILRLEIQMKKDFINCVFEETNDESFWNNRTYYTSQFVKAKKGVDRSQFDIAVTEVNARMRVMQFSIASDRNHQAFYAMSLGTFSKLYSGMFLRYHFDFTSKYSFRNPCSVDVLRRYFDTVRIIRNRCCHSNHMISAKLKNALIFNVSVLPGYFGDTGNEFEKTLYFIYSRLDNKESFKDDVIGLLKENISCWRPYCNKHLLHPAFAEDIDIW